MPRNLALTARLAWAAYTRHRWAILADAVITAAIVAAVLA